MEYFKSVCYSYVYSAIIYNKSKTVLSNEFLIYDGDYGVNLEYKKYSYTFIHIKIIIRNFLARKLYSHFVWMDNRNNIKFVKVHHTRFTIR